MAFVNNQGGQQKREDRAASGQPIDFDPSDESIVKVHYDLGAWSFDDRGELSEALANSEIPHYWDDDELVVPEAVEGKVDEMFEELEQQLGPFPVALEVDDASVEYGLDEWSGDDRSTLTDAMVEAEIPHRWEASTLFVAAAAEEAVDTLLDAIEAGELGPPSDDAGNEPPEGALSDIFLAANKLAKDPFDAKSRRQLIELDDVLDSKHPPYALPPRVWVQATRAVSAIVERINADADGGDVVDVEVDDAGRHEESSDVIGLAQQLRGVVREFV
ncbi:MAG: hypothetical protein AB8G26_13345 [Ilumatobacter sp.]